MFPLSFFFIFKDDIVESSTTTEIPRTSTISDQEKNQNPIETVDELKTIRPKEDASPQVTPADDIRTENVCKQSDKDVERNPIVSPK